jgi:uncharacterized protein YbjT (DUF2867 family)
MKAIVTGATGMVGKGVLIECLENKDITEVLVIGRRPLDMDHAKLKQLIHKDFSEFDSVKERLKGYDACYHCMGVSAASFSKEEYYKMTHGYSLALANTMLEVNPESTFIYVSGQGTDSNEKGTGWAAVKGKTENDILKLGFKQAFMFRPGGIFPKKGVEPSSKLYKRMMTWMGWLLHVMKAISPSSVVGSDEIGLAMIAVTQKGYQNKIVTPKDILALSK